MRNVSATHAYTLFDHVFLQTTRALSAVIGLKRITQPFWNRWFASGVDREIILAFLDDVGTIDNWATTAHHVIDREQAKFLAAEPGMSKSERIAALRKLSYLGHMAQWGCLPITPERTKLYSFSRDRYIEAEGLAWGERWRRVAIAWRGATYFANLHVRDETAPLVVIVHGIDGCKEEHLSTELSLHAAGFSTMCVDGPGQGEALLLDGLIWTPDFHRFISAAIDAAGEHLAVDASRTGLLGISIGGMWCYQAAAHDDRIKAIFDLGAPLHTRKFPSLPFLIKTRLCQVTGARTDAEVARVLAQNNIESAELIGAVKAHVRMVHGERDRVVTTEDKHHLLTQLSAAPHRREASLRVIEGGDHCCTGHFDAVRQDAVEFFTRSLLPRD